MLKRVETPEADPITLKSDVAEIRTNFATSADIAKLGVAMHSDINSQTWKFVAFACGFGTALVGAVYFIAIHGK